MQRCKTENYIFLHILSDYQISLLLILVKITTGDLLSKVSIQRGVTARSILSRQHFMCKRKTSSVTCIVSWSVVNLADNLYFWLKKIYEMSKEFEEDNY